MVRRAGIVGEKRAWQVLMRRGRELCRCFWSRPKKNRGRWGVGRGCCKAKGPDNLGSVVRAADWHTARNCFCGPVAGPEPGPDTLHNAINQHRQATSHMSTAKDISDSDRVRVPTPPRLLFFRIWPFRGDSGLATGLGRWQMFQLLRAIQEAQQRSSCGRPQPCPTAHPIYSVNYSAKGAPSRAYHQAQWSRWAAGGRALVDVVCCEVPALDISIIIGLLLFGDDHTH